MTTPDAPILSRLVGRVEPRAGIARSVRDGRLAHAYLILGTRGSGRTRFALGVAQLLLCKTESDAACGVCSGCRRVERGIHPDLTIVHPSTREELEDPSRTSRLFSDYAESAFDPLALSPQATLGIDQVRGLQAELAKARLEAPRRVALVLCADRMTEPAAQAALKLIEEPPPETTLLLTAPVTASLLPTLVSRCQRIDLRALTIDEITPLLISGGVEPAEATLLAGLSHGSVGRAFELRGLGILALRERALRLFDATTSGPREAEARVRAAADGWGADEMLLAIELALSWQRDLALLGSGLGPESCLHRDLAARVRTAPAPRELRRRLALLEELGRALHERVNPELALYAAVVRLGSGASAGDAA